MDSIHLIGVRCNVFLGVPTEERKKRQAVDLDLKLELPLDAAGRSDDVEDTVDYWRLEREVRRIAEGEEFHLAERLARRVGKGLLALDPRIHLVEIILHKRPKVMPKTREVLVRVCLSRKS